MSPGSDPSHEPDGVWLTYRSVTGPEVAESATVIGPVEQAPQWLAARSLQRSDGSQVCQLLVTGEDGYERLDNEILAGLRLARKARVRDYPREVSRLIGYDADSTTPFALVEPYRGDTVEEIAGLLTLDERQRFMVSLLVALRWLDEAGIVHRGITPWTVRWDGQSAQITDFSQATIVGAQQRPATQPGWAAVGSRVGPASEADDVLAAGLLIYYVFADEDLDRPEKLDDWPALRDQLAGVFAKEPGQRPSAHELLRTRLGVRDPVPRRRNDETLLDQGRADFEAHRLRKHPRLAAAMATSPALAAADQGENGSGPSERRARRRLLGGLMLMVLAVVDSMVWTR